MKNNSITFQSGFAHLEDLPCYVLCCGPSTAVISSYGAHLLSYQAIPGHEVLYLSPTAVWQNQSAIRGGVPICWPWFGPAAAELNPAGQSLPNHGVVRTALWQLAEQSVTEQAVSISFTIKACSLPYAKAPAYLCLTLVLTETDLSLTLKSDQGVQQAAFHSYFVVDSVQQATVSPLAGPYQDKVMQSFAVQQQQQLLFSAETDRIYPDTASELTLTLGSGTVQISQQGHDSSVLWNPWQDKTATLKDLPDTAYLDFVCVETARLRLETTEQLQLVQKIRYCG
jgi:glucose-6-phosphate 1-epimerase